VAWGGQLMRRCQVGPAPLGCQAGLVTAIVPVGPSSVYPTQIRHWRLPMFWAPAARGLATLGLGTVFVATPLPINFAALVLWVILVVGWVKRQARARGRRAG
jgi:hypothetical protein